MKLYFFVLAAIEEKEIIMANWYMSVRAAEFLLSKNTYITGTIRSVLFVHRNFAMLQRLSKCNVY